jgi:hypothetical protein
MLFLIMCTLQLIMLQHARVMTEYAAFAAARVGIVRNANPALMRNAAFVALLPTMRRSDSLDRAPGGAGGKTLRAVLRDVPAARAEAAGRLGMDMVQVRIVNAEEIREQIANNATHLRNLELDFDDIRPTVAKANQLQIQVRYFYELRIPFAGAMLQAIYFAARLGSLKQWEGPLMTAPEIAGQPAIRNTQSRASGIASDRDAGERPNEAAILAQAARQGRFFLPVVASYTMRMQSNVFRCALDDSCT